METMIYLCLFVIFLDLTKNNVAASNKLSSLNYYQDNVLGNLIRSILGHLGHAKVLNRDAMYNDYDQDKNSKYDDHNEERVNIFQKYKYFPNTDLKIYPQENLLSSSPQESINRLHNLHRLSDKNKDTILYFNVGNKKYALRKKWNSAINLKAAKLCTCACKSSLKTMCTEYKCQGEEKRLFKKDCKSKCYTEFDADPDDDEADDSEADVDC